jgi:hypothetical protein
VAMVRRWGGSGDAGDLRDWIYGPLLVVSLKSWWAWIEVVHVLICCLSAVSLDITRYNDNS